MGRHCAADLYRDQHDAEYRFPLGSFWRHNESGKVYEIVAHGIDEEHGEATIGYKAAPKLLDNGLVRVSYDAETVLVWYRRQSKWTETVSWHDLEAVQSGPRFTSVQRKQVYS